MDKSAFPQGNTALVHKRRYDRSGDVGDVAIALSQGAKHIDAVEIDSQLYQLGKQLHPDKPYEHGRTRNLLKVKV